MTTIRANAKKRMTANKRSEFIGFKLDRHTLSQLDKLADTQGASRSFVIRQLLTAALISYGTKPQH